MKKFLLVILIATMAGPANAKMFAYELKNGATVITDDFCALPKEARHGLMAELDCQPRADCLVATVVILKWTGSRC